MAATFFFGVKLHQHWKNKPSSERIGSGLFRVSLYWGYQYLHFMLSLQELNSLCAAWGACFFPSTLISVGKFQLSFKIVWTCPYTPDAILRPWYWPQYNRYHNTEAMLWYVSCYWCYIHKVIQGPWYIWYRSYRLYATPHLSQLALQLDMHCGRGQDTLIITIQRLCCDTYCWTDATLFIAIQRL